MHLSDPEAKRALDYMLEEGRKEGLVVKNIDRWLAILKWAKGRKSSESFVMSMSSLQVAIGRMALLKGPWTDGKLFGRGAIDDKGPTIAAWHAMKMVKDSGHCIE